MDSVSQAALGAAVGEAALGRQLGYKAAMWGAVVATVPDMDVVVNPFLNEVTRIGWHRGYSHSLIFIVAAAFSIGWLFNRFSKAPISYRQWTSFAFWCLITAVVLDCFTVYGTQLFVPFSRYQVAFNNASIIDPIVTLPLLIGVIAALFLKRSGRARRIVNTSGLAIVGLYLIVVTPAVKGYVNGLFVESLKERKIEYTRYMSTPTIFNSILWRMTAESDEGYWVGYYSLFDKNEDVDLQFLPRNKELLQPVIGSRAVQELLWFSGRWYTVDTTGDTIRFSDLRFGEFGVGTPDEGRYVFTWSLVRDPETGRVRLKREDPEIEDAGKVFYQLIERMQGIE